MRPERPVTATRSEFDAWLVEFRIRRDDLLGLLRAHHHRGDRFGVELFPNSRAQEQIEDACRVAEALMVLARQRA